MRTIIEKLIIYTVLSGYYFIMEDEFNIIIALISFILIFSTDLVRVKSFNVIVSLIMTGLVFIDYDWLYYFPMVVQLTALTFGKWSVPSLLMFTLFPDWMLFASSIAVMYTAKLNNQLDILEFENKNIRDQLTKDNLRLRSQHNELMKNHEREVYLAGLNERNRIARDMHDALGHSLSSSILLIESLQYVKEPEKIEASLKQLQGRLKSGMDDIRTSIHHLYDTSIDFKSRVEEYLSEMEHWNTDFQYQVESTLPHYLKVDLLSLIREALTNVRKHSAGDSITVLIREHPEFITVSVKDNGTHYRPGKGMGIETMKETVHKYRGVLNTFFDKGFTVHVILYKEAVFDEDHNY
ncbi:sensor histidine kinase [Corticicoccus populi]|uniref:histidine kinase n=1 Tax=Corticicoccus populi TaxID=1812821 RepID=A0ABW5WZ15_9STAP